MILDTNALSAIAEGHPALESLLRTAADVAVPVIVLGEYRYGIRQSHHHRHYQQWLDEFLPSYRVLDVDQQTTVHYAEIRSQLKKAGTPIPSNDVWVAALCQQYELPVLSLDRHFDAVRSIRRLNW